MSQTILPPGGAAPGDHPDQPDHADQPDHPERIPDEALSDTLRRLERDVRRAGGRDGWTIGMFVASVLALVVAGVFVGIGINRMDKRASSAPAAPATIDATLTEFHVELSGTEVAEGGSITVANGGTIQHNLGITGTDATTGPIDAGRTGVLDLTGFAPGTYEIWCDIPGHADSGMTGTITIVAGGEGATDAAAAMGMTPEEHAAMGDETMTPEEAAAMDQKMLDSMAAYPAETEGHGNQVLAPTILPDGTKHFELTASIIDWEVRPGEIVKAWAYNGQVPGPRVNLEVGDRVEVQITNDLPVGTDIHWHGIDVPDDQDGVSPYTQDLIRSGETYTYHFTTTEPAIGMYHAHIHGQEAIPNGMFGTLYVGDVQMPAGRTVSGIGIPADLTIAQDIPMVVNDAGTIGLTLNAKSFPATEPIVVNQGDWVKLTYFNEGLQAHPMHLHGFEQIVYAKDGEPLDSPYAADTILVGPGERYTVLFHADQVGTWVFHCHILNHVESSDGMFGMATAVIVQ